MNGVISAGFYANESEIVKDALRYFFSMKPSLRIAAAIELFKKKEVTLSRASEISGISREEFKEMLEDRGIKIILKEKTKEELESQYLKFKNIRGK